jgi:hypothetical protein
MLTLIGWLGCAYLAVKGLELYASRADSSAHLIGAIVAWIFASVFALLFLLADLSSGTGQMTAPDWYSTDRSEQDRASLRQDCLSKATTQEQRTACRELD